MRKVKNSILIIVFILALLYVGPSNALATNVCPQPTITTDVDTFNTVVKIRDIPNPRSPLTYNMRVNNVTAEGKRQTDPKDGHPIWIFNFSRLTPGEYDFKLLEGPNETYCEGILTVPDKNQGGEVYSPANKKIEFIPSNPQGTDSIQAIIQNLQEDGRYMMRIIRLASGQLIEDTEKLECQNSKDKTIKFLINPLNENQWQVTIWKVQNNNSASCFLPQSFDPKEFKEIGYGIITISRTLPPTPIPTELPSPLPPCSKWVYFYDKDDPNSRLNGEPIATGYPEYINPNFTTRKCIAIQTGIGEISTEPQGFVKRIFSFVLGIAGGIALILIIISGYRLMASQGNPEQITAARDQLISAIVGLLFIILSFVILQVIGVDILKIPGFTK